MLYDATLPIQEDMLTFPGDPPFHMKALYTRNKGDPFDLAALSMSTHMGTHIDPPAHYIDGGKTVDELPLESLVGPGVVLDLLGKQVLDRKTLSQAPIGHAKRVLFKTDNGPLLLKKDLHEDYVHLAGDGAEYLVNRGVLLVGIDYLSIERYMNPGAPVHRTLLNAGVVIVEGVHLLSVPPGPYEIFCLPLPIRGADGAPCRIVLRSRPSNPRHARSQRLPPWPLPV
jgi:arylformamidase